MKRLLTKVRLVSVALLIVCSLVFAGGASQVAGTKHQPYDRTLSASEQRWIDQTISSMTRDEKIGQLLAADANAIFMNREGEAHRKLVHHVVNNKVGTLILFRSDVWASAILINRLQQMARVPLLVSADLEMGPGMRFNDTEWWAPNMAVAATGSPSWARRQGELTAVEARAIGINWLYAPVADVNNNPDNPVINTRSFGEDPADCRCLRQSICGGCPTGWHPCDRKTLSRARRYRNRFSHRTSCGRFRSQPSGKDRACPLSCSDRSRCRCSNDSSHSAAKDRTRTRSTYAGFERHGTRQG